MGLIPGFGRYSGGGNGNPLQCSCLEDSMDRGVWQASVYGVAENWTWLSTHTHVRLHIHTHSTTTTTRHLKEEQVSMAEGSFVCRYEWGSQSSDSFALCSSYWFLSHRPFTKRLICSRLWFFETWSSFDVALKVIPRGKGIRTLQPFWAIQTLGCLLYQLFTGTAANSSDVICHLP